MKYQTEKLAVAKVFHSRSIEARPSLNFIRFFPLPRGMKFRLSTAKHVSCHVFFFQWAPVPKALKFCEWLESSFCQHFTDLPSNNVDCCSSECRFLVEKYFRSISTWTPPRGKGRREGLSLTSWSKFRILNFAFTRSVWYNRHSNLIELAVILDLAWPKFDQPFADRDLLGRHWWIGCVGVQIF